MSRLLRSKAHRETFFLTEPRFVDAISGYLHVEELISLSRVNKHYNVTCHSGCPLSWSKLIRLHFFQSSALVDGSSNYNDFKILARRRIWSWDSVFRQRIFWARVGFTLANVIEDSRIFGCSFCSRSPKSRECQKLDNDFEDWDDGHRIVFDLPAGYFLSYEINDHTMGTWRLGKGADVAKWHVLDRLDGHPVGPGFSYQEVKQLISYITDHCTLTFDNSFLWPMFFPAIAMTTDVKVHLGEFMENLHSGLSNLRLPQKNFDMLRAYFEDRISSNEKKSEELRPRSWNRTADHCFREMMTAVEHTLS